MSLLYFSTPPDGPAVGLNKGRPPKSEVCSVAEVGARLSLGVKVFVLIASLKGYEAAELDP